MGKYRRLYLMLSRTNTRVGFMIRTFSRYPYNHVSLTLDPSFSNWVSFARYVQDAPFYGGFVSESMERYLADGRDSRVRVFSLSITEEKYRRLEKLFSMTDQPDCGLLYNYFDALASVFRMNISIPGAYTCASFAGKVLERRWLTIREVDEALRDYLVYEGPLSALAQGSGMHSPLYGSNLGLARGMWNAARQMADLSKRMLGRSCADVVAQQLR